MSVSFVLYLCGEKIFRHFTIIKRKIKEAGGIYLNIFFGIRSSHINSCYLRLPSLAMICYRNLCAYTLSILCGESAMPEMCFHWVGGSVRHSWQGKTLIEQHAGQQKGCKMFNNKSRGNNNHLNHYMSLCPQDRVKFCHLTHPLKGQGYRQFCWPHIKCSEPCGLICFFATFGRYRRAR